MCLLDRLRGQTKPFVHLQSDLKGLAVRCPCLARGCVHAGVTVFHSVTGDALQAAAHGSKSWVGGKQVGEQDGEIVRLLNGQTALGEQTLQEFFDGLLAMKANLIG
jgi:hypothetical protein